MIGFRNKGSLKLVIIAVTTIISFSVSYICLLNNEYAIFHNLFYLPVILSCLWYDKKGFIYSEVAAALYFLFSILKDSEPFWNELVRSIVFILLSFIIYKLADRIRYSQFNIANLSAILKNDIERFKKAEMLSHLGSYEVNLRTGKVTWSDELFRIFGFEPQSFEPSIEKRIEMTHPDDRKLIREGLDKSINDKCGFVVESRIVRKDGSIRWLLSVINAEYDEKDNVKSYIGSLLDITERKLLKESIEEEKEKLRITIASIGDGVISTDVNGKVTIINRVAEELTGWTQSEALGRPIEEVFNIINQDTKEKCESPVHKIIKNGSTIGLEDHTALVSKDGRIRLVADSASPIRGNDGNIQGAILVFRDITEEKKRQEEIAYISYHDHLTGLYNRRFFEEEIKRIDVEDNLPISIIMGDANGLKITNDAFGHREGDRLLRKAAEAINSVCRPGDIAVRWGGDEFVILLPKTKQEEAKAIVKKIISACCDNKIDSVNVSISFGWDTKEKSDEDISKILNRAEDYMYKHKVTESHSMRGNVINTIINTLHEKNPREEKHSKRVSELCQRIGTAMELHEIEINKLKVSGLLHDIGKIAIDERMLNKSERLTEQEWNEVKKHPDIGCRILSTSSEMVDIAQCILYHHEKFDGSGYPKGLKKDEIPLLARIITVADSYDAMTSERPYKNVMDKNMAIRELVRNKGTQFDPNVVDIFVGKVLKTEVKM